MAAGDSTSSARCSASYHSARLASYVQDSRPNSVTYPPSPSDTVLIPSNPATITKRKPQLRIQKRTVALIRPAEPPLARPWKTAPYLVSLPSTSDRFLSPPPLVLSTLSLENPSTYRPAHPPIHASLHLLSSLLSSGLRFCHFFSLSAFMHFVASRLLLVRYSTSLFYTAASATVAHLFYSSFAASAYTPDRTFGISACKGRTL